MAVKKCFDAFNNATDAQRTFREIMFLQQLYGHEHVVKLVNIHKASNDRDIYIVCEYMESDLHAVIKANILEPIHKQFIVHQLLKVLKFMHTGQIIHRDVKPSNVLINSACHIKLCDFGLARSVSCSPSVNGLLLGGIASPVASMNPGGYSTTGGAIGPVMTDYVATRWYRAPEILLGSNAYTLGVDIWSIGCILGEMLLGKPLFPGSNTIDQVSRVLGVTGFPSVTDIESMRSPCAGSIIEAVISSSPEKRPGLASIVPAGSSQEALNLMQMCFQFNPARRPTARELLRHPFVVAFHDDRKEPDAPGPIRLPVDDNIKYTVDDYRNRLYFEIVKRHNEVRQTRLPEPEPADFSTPSLPKPATDQRSAPRESQKAEHSAKSDHYSKSDHSNVRADHSSVRVDHSVARAPGALRSGSSAPLVVVASTDSSGSDPQSDFNKNAIHGDPKRSAYVPWGRQGSEKNVAEKSMPIQASEKLSRNPDPRNPDIPRNPELPRNSYDSRTSGEQSRTSITSVNGSILGEKQGPYRSQLSAPWAVDADRSPYGFSDKAAPAPVSAGLAGWASNGISGAGGLPPKSSIPRAPGLRQGD